MIGIDHIQGEIIRLKMQLLLEAIVENMTDNDVKQMGASNIKSLKKLKTSYYDWVVFFDMHNLENELGIEHSNY